MGIGFATALRDDRLQAIVDKLDSGSGDAATIEIYSEGSGRPATGGAITDQDLLGILTLSKPCGTVTTGTLVFDLIADELAAKSTESISWVRFKNTSSVFVVDMGAGLSGSGQEMIFDKIMVKLGGKIKLLSGSITEGNL